MKKGKQIIVTGLLLMLFAIFGAAMVGVTFEGTAEQIADNERRAMLRSLNEIVPQSQYDNDLLHDTLQLEATDELGQKHPSLAYIARKQDDVVAVIFSAIAPDGYSGEIKLLIGIKADGSLAGVRIVHHKETPGLGDQIELKRSDWVLAFDGKSLKHPDKKGWKVKRDGGEFDQFTGATITPRAVVKAVHKALLYFKHEHEHLLNDEDKHKDKDKHKNEHKDKDEHHD